jgi:hypothetical protein
MRVLHAPVNVGNQPWSLSRAERALGLHSDLVVNYQTWLGYPADRVNGSLHGRTPRELLRRTWSGLSAPFRYDVLHYYFGRSLMYWDDLPRLNRAPFADLRLARRLGKTIIMTLQGCDARLAGESNRNNRHTPCAPGRCGAFETCIATLDAQRRYLIEDILPLCDRVFYLNPELGHFVPGAQFLPYANVDVRASDVIPPRTEGPPRIVHAPSDGRMKGTAAILAALDELKRDFEFELILVQGKSHTEAMEIYRSADIAIDQILCGWYGGFAVEMMAMGKPVLCHMREADLGFVPDAMRAELPIVDIHPDRLVQDIGRALAARGEWAEWSRRSRAFVEHWHDPARIAAALAEVYRGPTAAADIDRLIAAA